MKTRVIPTILMTLALGAFSAMTATAQHEGHSKKTAMPHDQMMMADEPHHVLAMAYHHNLIAFAKALQEHTARTSSVNVEFARAAATEMRRSFDQMKHHHQEHMQTMSAAMQTKMSGMMQKMEAHHTELNAQIAALEHEVQSATPDAKKVSSLAASIHTHLDAMSKMMQDGKGSTMKMKM